MAGTVARPKVYIDYISYFRATGLRLRTGVTDSVQGNINDVFVSELIHLDKDAFIFCDYETVENIILGLYKLTKNKRILSEMEDPCLIEINDSYKYLKIRNIELHKIN